MVDLGVAQDIIGNFFNDLVTFGFKGATKELRVQELWSRLRAYYAEAKSPVRLDSLTADMFQRAKQAPKLRAKGGETRHLLPFCAILSKELMGLSEHWAAVHHCLDALLECAKTAATFPFDADRLAMYSRRVCLLWKALSEEQEGQGNLNNWRIKPKMHLFQELCEFKAARFGSPELFWCYMDESWCGFMATAAKRRGGRNPAAAVPERLLNRFRAMRG